MRDFAKTLLKAGFIKVAGIGLTFVFLLIVARYSSDQDYGIFAAIFSAATILGFVAVGGQQMLILRYWPSFDETESIGKADAALRWSWRRVLVITAIVTLIMVAGSFLYTQLDPSPPFLITHVWPLLAMTLAFAFSEFAQGALRARGEVLISLSGREVLWRVASIGAILAIGTMSGADFVYLAAGTLALITILQLWLVYRAMAPAQSLPTEDRLDMRRRSLWFWLGTSVGPVANHSGTIVVAIVLGPQMAGAYFAADRLAKLLSIALIAVNQVLGPQLSRSFHAGRHGQVQKLMTLSTLAAGTIAVIGAGVFAIFGGFALSLFSEGYADVSMILTILTLGQVVNAFCGPNALLMNMAGLERMNTVIMAGTGVLGLAALWFCAQNFGLTGAAVAAALTMVVWNGLITYQCKVRLGIVPMRFGKTDE